MFLLPFSYIYESTPTCILHYEKFADGSVKCIEDEIPFELPEGWAWIRLQCFVSFIGGSQPPKSTFEYAANKDNIRFIQIRDYKTDKYPTFIPRAKARRFCSKDDVMIGRYGPPIFQILRGLEGSYNVALMKAVADPVVMLNDYLYYLLQDGELLKMLESLSDRTCGQDGINMYELNRYIVGIPPLEEQDRIIRYLVTTLSIIDNITHRKDELQSLINSAKSKILDLAIRGKLVPQDPNDEPASVLLECIRTEKEALIQQGKIKRDKKESVIFKGEDNSYYEKIGEKVLEYGADKLPCGWSLASFSQVNMFIPETVDPSNFPDEMFELYSVPNFEVGAPEIILGGKIGSSKQSLCENDVLVCKINPRINRVWITGHITPHRLLGSSEWIVFRNHLLFVPYFRYYFSSPHFRNLMLTNVSGVGGSLMRAQPESVKKYPILVPPFQEQVRITTCIDKLFSLLAIIGKSLS